MREHEEREAVVYGDVARALAARGVEVDTPRRVVPSRNTVLYAVITVITAGLFSVYWMYAAARDGNRHVEEHSRVDAALERAVSTLASG